LEGLAEMLAPTLQEDAVRATVQRLLQRANKERSQAALEVLARGIDAALERRFQPLSMTRLSLGFQAESSVWQGLPLPGTDERCVRDGLERCYRRGQEISVRQLDGRAEETVPEWCRWARYSFFHLDSIRAALSADNRAQRWCLGRLIDAFCKHDGLLGVRGCLPDVGFEAKDLIRVEAVLEDCLDESRRRALKLVPHTYGRAAEAFRESVWTDATRFAFDYNLPLPRSA
jgi:hypothetical protein